MTIGMENLPAGWTAKQAEDGRIFYMNHTSKTSTWERPTAAAAPPVYSEAGTAVVAPTTAYHTTSVAAAMHPQLATMSGPSPAAQLGCCSFLGPRIFWISAGLSWVVWIFSVASAGDQNWMMVGDEGAGIVDKNGACDEYYANDGACAAYEAFIATQIIATVMFSMAAVIYTVTFFRPSEAKLGSTIVLGLVGGIITAFATFFQNLAFIFADKRVQENNEEWGEGFENGPTFAVGVTTFVFGFIQAILVLLSFSSAGDGPLLPLVRGWATPNELAAPKHPSHQTQATMKQDAQVTISIPQSAQIESSLQQGTFQAHPPQSHGADKGPPPAFDSNDLGSNPSQPNAAGEVPPPAYDSNDLRSKPSQPNASGESPPPAYDSNVNVGLSSI